MKLRVSPWFTDSSIIFLNNLFKWYPACVNKVLTILEWGGGNSSIYFLQKQCKVLSIENDPDFSRVLSELVRKIGYKVHVAETLDEAAKYFDQNDLTILHANKFEDVGERVFDLNEWSFIINDGISRLQVMDAIIKRADNRAIVLLDNVEYCANWGKLERCSAHPDRVKSYRRMLRDPFWRYYLFAQSEGRDGHSVPDCTGWEAPYRWITGILWRHDHLLAKLMITHFGLPLVTLDGLDDQDIETISERCPFDWEKMKWLVDEYTNVFHLQRKFE